MVMPMHEDCSNMNPEHSQGGGTQLHMWFADMHAYTLDLRYWNNQWSYLCIFFYMVSNIGEDMQDSGTGMNWGLQRPVRV